MLKATLIVALRSKSDVAQVNALLCNTSFVSVVVIWLRAKLDEFGY
jgi:hypothetical protein